MRKLAFLSTAAAALLLAGGLSAQAQQTATPSTAKGAGAECSRMTDAKMRDDCVRNDKTATKAKKDQATHDAKKDGAKKTDAPVDATAKGKKS